MASLWTLAQTMGCDLLPDGREKTSTNKIYCGSMKAHSAALEYVLDIHGRLHILDQCLTPESAQGMFEAMEEAAHKVKYVAH